MAIEFIKHIIKVNKGEAKTIFEAKLSFKDEVAPNQREEIRKRLDCGNFENYWRNTEGINLEKYLYRNHFKYSEEDHLINYIRHFGGFFQKYKFKPLKKNLSLNICAKADGKVGLEDMIDLGALNNFILTEKY